MILLMLFLKSELFWFIYIREIYHRDIKPENILVLNNHCHIGDFGLVDFPDKKMLTHTGDQIGAKWTIAPEMRRNGSMWQEGQQMFIL